MQNNTIFFKAPNLLFSESQVLKLLKFFKYELIKLLVFLFLFLASVYFVNSQSKEYYRNNVSMIK